MLEILAQTDGQQTGGGLGSLVVFLPLILLFWFFLIRPQRQRMKQHQSMISEVSVGDEVETVAGMYGRITDMADDVLWCEIAPGTVIKMSRAAVRRRIVEEEPPPPGGGSGE
ncbi:MAG TPA: preprotein translocase subunit YajC [Actinomycetota bacterium]